VNAQAPRPAAEPQALRGTSACAAQALALVRAARLELLLESEALDARVYGSAAFAAAVQDFALATPRAQLRLLVRDPRAALRNAPALIELARRLTSQIELREPAADQREVRAGECLIADRRAMLERARANELEARLWLDAPALGLRRAADFDTLWNQAVPSPELRRLSL
jgi:hypothetical protein